MFQNLLHWMLENPEKVVAYIGAIMAFVKGAAWVRQTFADARAKRVFAALHKAFWAVEEFARLAPANEKLQSAAKLAAALDKADTALEALGEAPMSSAERADAVHTIAAINAQDHAGAGSFG